MNNEYLLREGPVGKLIIKLCIPSVVIMLVFVVYNMADIFFIGKTGDPLQVAAIIIIGPLFSVVHAIGTLIGNGAAIGIGIALGKKEYKKMDAIAGFGFYGSLFLGGLMSIVVLLFAKNIVFALGADNQIYSFALSYIRVLAMGIPIMLTSSVLANVVRADGSSHISMIGNIIGTVINIILDPLFILVLNLGTQGAAIATIIGNGVSLIYFLYYILKKQTHISLSIKSIIMSKESTVDILLLGVPMAFGTLLMSFATVFRNNILGDYGNVVIAASGIAGRVGMLNGLLIMGIAMGIQPAISYNYGAGNLQRLKEIIKKTWLTTVIIGLVFTVLIFIFRATVVQLFIEDVQVISYGGRFILGTLITGPVLGIYQLSSSFLQGTGKVSYGTIVALLRKGIVYIPILFIMHYLFGLNGIIYSAAIADCLSIAIAFALSLRWYYSIKESSITLCQNS